MKESVKAFIEWLEKGNVVICKVMDNYQTIAEIDGTVLIGEEMNQNGYPVELMVKGNGKVDIGKWYINGIDYVEDNDWWIVHVDAYQSYYISK